MIYYVDTNAFRDGDGSKERPFKHICDAAKIAIAGDEVLVASGIYREKVTPANAGTKDAPIVYKSIENLGAIITGAEEICGWKKLEENLWTVRVNNDVFADYNPYTTRVYGDWYFSPKIRHTGAVFLNDNMMYECDSIDDCKKGEPNPFAWNQHDASYLWFAEQDTDSNETILYANFQGLDPNKENVEILVRRNCFMPDENGINYITVSGFNINKAATTWAPPAAYQDGMIGPHWSKGWIIEDCEIYGSRCCGISLGKYMDSENDMYFTVKKVKSPTQMERDAVCRGQYHGWLKENVGHHIIRRCNIHHCEQTGIVGRMGGVFSTIEDCHIHHICNSQQLGGAETAGIKLHAAIDVTIRRNHIHNNIMGIWLDWEAQGARVSGNLMHDNCRPRCIEQADGAMFNTDVFVEVGHGPTLIDNNLLLSPVAITIPSEGIACVHNLVLGSFSLINSGVDSIINNQREPRYTPYHIRHRTEVAGFMTILHGDDRIYNNIFVQQYPITDNTKTAADANYQGVGTAPFDIFPTYEEWYKPFSANTDPDMGGLAEAHFGHLPVWIDGNVYLNGANVYKNEVNKIEAPDYNPEIILEIKDGNYIFKNKLNNIINSFYGNLISTESLGLAFEPEQAFENPDGTPIVFDKDYFGNHRSIKPIPGPFADYSKNAITVW